MIMLKRILPLLPVLLLAGCTTATFTRLTPNSQPRNANNLYPVEVTFDSTQQSLREDSIQPYVLVNGQPLPLRPVPLVKNRWEGVVPVPATAIQPLPGVSLKVRIPLIIKSVKKDAAA